MPAKDLEQTIRNLVATLGIHRQKELRLHFLLVAVEGLQDRCEDGILDVTLILTRKPHFEIREGHLFACKGSNNMTSHCDANLDALLLASDQELDPAKRIPLMKQAQELLAQDAFSFPIYYNVTPIVITSKLGNFKASGTNLGSFWNVYEWYLNK